MKAIRRILPIVMITVLVFGTSCKSKMRLFGTDKELESKERTELMEDALAAQLDFKTITAKGSVELQMGKSSKKVSTHFKIIKDSLIQASIRPILGMEMARLTITTDSVILIDRMGKQYVAENFDKIIKTNGIDFNFYNLQAMLTNQIFVPGNKSIETKDYSKFEINKTSDAYQISTIDRNKFIYNFSIDASDRVVSMFVNNSKKEVSIKWTYQDFVKDGDYLYPLSMYADIGLKKQKLGIGISYTKLEIDKETKVDNTIPSNYKKVEIKDVLSSYIK